eukprot:g346.t1
MSNAAVVGYSLSYPMGVLGVMLAISLMQRWFRIDYRKELQEQNLILAGDNIKRRTVRITQAAIAGQTVREVFQRFQKRLVFGRMQREGVDQLPNMDTELQLNDQLVIIGNAEVVEEATTILGEAHEKELSYDRTAFDVRRLFVSNPKIAGEKIASLNLAEQFSTIITRVQRGDVDLLASGETVLELGDRVLVIARRKDFDDLKRLFGNSYEALNHINLLSFGSGKTIRILTNDASRSPEQQAERFEAQGLPGIAPEEVITSGMMAKLFLEQKVRTGSVAYLGTESAAHYILAANLNSKSVSEIDLEDCDEITAMVFLDDEGFNWNTDINTVVNLLRKQNIPAIVANSDKLYPVAKNDVSIATGGIAKLVESILNRKFIHFGKPDTQMFNYAFEDIKRDGNFERDDILMVGDTLHTDILGGNKFGVTAIHDRFRNLEEQLADPTVISDMDRFQKTNKEYKKLQPIVDAYLEYKQLLGNIETAEEMLKDAEMKELASMELEELRPKQEEMEEEIKIMLIPRDPEDERDVILEIRSGTGGDEASIFAGDLLRMYTRYFDEMGWKYELLYENEGSVGGYNKVVVEVRGEDVFGRLKFESGAHRVQRVPKTESQGRVHTSAATVAVMPKLELEDVEIRKSDLKIDTFRASGAGGQHVNKTESAIRITHLPTGIVSESQDGRSQHKNKEIAMAQLLRRIQEQQRAAHEAEQTSKRRSLVGSGDRSDKIRTYNYPQNRVTDHRINLTLYNLDQIVEGQIGGVIEALQMAENTAKMEEGAI